MRICLLGLTVVLGCLLAAHFAEARISSHRKGATTRLGEDSADELPSYSVGFDLTDSYLTASIRLANGRLVPESRILIGGDGWRLMRPTGLALIAPYGPSLRLPE
jgi:hypothetical protein